jgi:signal peptidase I
VSQRPPEPGDAASDDPVTTAPVDDASPIDPSATPDTAEDGAAGEDAPKGKKGAFWRELPVLIVMALVLALLIKTLLIQAFFIPSPSMVPTLEPGDRVLVNKVIYRLRDPSRGEVIVFENPHPVDQPATNPVSGAIRWVSRGLGFSQAPDEDFIKRIIGMPGDHIEGKNGHVFINGQELDEPYLNGVETGDFGPVDVPEGQYFVMGDNRGNSNDSRYALGTIPRDKIVGQAFVIIWPPGRWGGL